MRPATDIAAQADLRQSETALATRRGTGRLLAGLGFSVMPEMPLASGRRADLVALSPAGEVWIVEIKSSRADLRADRKWPIYRMHCDRLYFAAPPELEADIFPADAGLIAADAYGATILREAPEHRMSAATRRALTLRFARLAALRLHAHLDPAALQGIETG